MSLYPETEEAYKQRDGESVHSHQIRLIQKMEELEGQRNALAAKFTKLDKPKYSGDPMMDDVLMASNADFDAWVKSLPPTYWARYDLSAARIGWEAGCKFILENADAMATAPKVELDKI